MNNATYNSKLRVKVVSDDLTGQLNEKANELFENLITPIFKELIEEYDCNHISKVNNKN